MQKIYRFFSAAFLALVLFTGCKPGMSTLGIQPGEGDEQVEETESDKKEAQRKKNQEYLGKKEKGSKQTGDRGAKKRKKWRSKREEEKLKTGLAKQEAQRSKNQEYLARKGQNKKSKRSGEVNPPGGEDDEGEKVALYQVVTVRHFVKSRGGKQVIKEETSVTPLAKKEKQKSKNQKYLESKKPLENRAGRGEPLGGENSDGGDVTVYHVVKHGKTIYVGITNDFKRRKAEHARSKRAYSIKRINSNLYLSRDDARGVEQALINIHGRKGKEQNGTLDNVKSSIAKGRTKKKKQFYKDQVSKGYEKLHEIGYITKEARNKLLSEL